MNAPILTFISAFAVIVIISLAESSNFGRMNGAMGFIGVLTVSSVCLLPLFSAIVDICKNINQGTVFMSGFIPVFSSVLVMSGKTLTSSLSSGTLLFAAEIAESVISYIVIPLCSALFALSVSSGISGGVFTKCTETVKKFSRFVMTTVTSLFCGILSLQTVIGTAGDSLSLRSAKMVAGTTPIIGGALSEATSIVAWCIKSLCSSTAIIGIIVFSAMVLPTIIELLLWRIAVFFTAVCAEMFGCLRIKRVSESFSDILAVLFSAIVNTFVLFTVSITVITLLGGSN